MKLKLTTWLLISLICVTNTFAKIINVRDFGAKGDGMTDDSAAFDRAQERLKLEDAGTIFKVPAGEYFFAGDGKYNNGNYLFDKLSNVTIEGDGDATVFLFGNYMFKGLRAMNCQNVTFRNFKIKFAKPIFAQGKVIKSDNMFELIVELDKLTPTLPENKPQNLIFFRDDAIYDHSNPRNEIKNLEKIANNQYKITTSWQLKGSDVTNKTAVLLFRNNNSTAFNNEFNNNCKLENITIVNGPASAFSASNCSNMQFINCKVIPEKGKFLSTVADGIHVKNNRIGPKIKNCTFRNMFDDSINISTMAEPVCKIDGDKIFIDSSLSYQNGDNLAFYDGRNLEAFGNGIISKLERASWNNKRVWVATIANAKLPTERTLENLKQKQIDRENLPLVVVNNSLAGAGTEISDCSFGNHRARGILLRAPAKISNCTFSNLRGPAILLGPEIFWLESGDVSNILIEGNRFQDIGLTNIQTEVFTQAHRPAELASPVIKNLTIRENTFDNYGIEALENANYGVRGCAINISNGDNVLIEDNIFKKRHQSVIDKVDLITTNKSKNITIQNNIIENQEEL